MVQRIDQDATGGMCDIGDDLQRGLQAVHLE